MTRSLPLLATELVESIARALENKKDILSLRLACRDLHDKTSNVFGETFFHTIETDLSPQDTERMKSIATHENLRRHVKELCIDITNRTRWRSGSFAERRRQERVLGLGYHWPRDEEGALKDDLPILPDMCKLLESDFPRCRDFRVTNFPRMLTETDYGEVHLAPTDAIAILLRIIALTGIRVSSFSVTGRLELEAKYLRSSLWECGHFDKVWGESLRNLDLHCGFWFEADEPLLKAFTIRLVSAAKSLRTLQFRMNSRSSAFGYDNDESQLRCGHDHLFREIWKASDAVPLENLVITWARASADVIIPFLLKFRDTLSTLVLDCIQLDRGTWHEIIETLQDQFPKLEAFTISCVSPPESLGDYMLFRDLHKDSRVPATLEAEKFELAYHPQSHEVGILGVRYRGNSMRVALDVLLRNMYSETAEERNPNRWRKPGLLA